MFRDINLQGPLTDDRAVASQMEAYRQAVASRQEAQQLFDRVLSLGLALEHDVYPGVESAELSDRPGAPDWVVSLFVREEALIDVNSFSQERSRRGYAEQENATLMQGPAKSLSVLHQGSEGITHQLRLSFADNSSSKPSFVSTAVRRDDGEMYNEKNTPWAVDKAKEIVGKLEAFLKEHPQQI